MFIQQIKQIDNFPFILFLLSSVNSWRAHKARWETEEKKWLMQKTVDNIMRRFAVVSVEMGALVLHVTLLWCVEGLVLRLGLVHYTIGHTLIALHEVPTNRRRDILTSCSLTVQKPAVLLYNITLQVVQCITSTAALSLLSNGKPRQATWGSESSPYTGFVCSHLVFRN